MTPKQTRQEIKRILSLLEDKHRAFFNRMYAPYDITQDVNITVDTMEPKQLSWAFTQCSNTYNELFQIIKRG